MTTSQPFHLNRSIARTLVLSLAAGGLLSVATTSRADDAADFEKSSQFIAALKDSIDAVAEDCKLQLNVTTNIAAADLTPWTGAGKSGPPGRMMRNIGQGCRRAIDSIHSICRSNADKDAWQPVIAREIKGVRCQFTGHQPRRKGQNVEAWYRNNVTFANGVLTVLMAPDLLETDEAATIAVMAGLASKPGAPAVPKDLVPLGGNGEKCTRWEDCVSSLCTKGVCGSCSATVKCRTGAKCNEGLCRTPAEIQQLQELRARREQEREEVREEEPSPSSPAAKGTPKGSAKGRMCGKDKDCQSGACKMENKTRGRCQ